MCCQIEAIPVSRYRTAMNKLGSSSHTLEFERGKYTKPKTDISERRCPVCNTMDDEINFLVNWKLYEAQRLHCFGKFMTKVQILNEHNDVDEFIILKSSMDNKIVAWSRKFIYNPSIPVPDSI